MYSDRRGNGQKPTPDKTFQTKDTLTKHPCEQLRENLYRGFLSRFFVLGQLKPGGPRYVMYFWGVPECVTKCNRGTGSKLAKNRATYFMDAPNVAGRQQGSIFGSYYDNHIVYVRGHLSLGSPAQISFLPVCFLSMFSSDFSCTRKH